MGVKIEVYSSWSKDAADAPLVYEFNQEKIVIGRSPGSDVQLPHPAVSGSHSVINVQGATHSIVDLDSTNGTRVNGEKLSPNRAKILRNHDVVELGGFRLEITLNVAIGESTTGEKTSDMARRLVRNVLRDRNIEVDSPKITAIQGAEVLKTYDIPPPPVKWVIGRAPHCDISLPDVNASREHAKLERDLSGVTITDLGSKNGVSFNGRRLPQRLLSDRDEIRIGTTLLVYDDPAAKALADIEAQPDEVFDLLPFGRASQPGAGAGFNYAQEPSQELISKGRTSARPGANFRQTLHKKKARMIDYVIMALAATILVMSGVAIYWIMQPVN